MRFLILLLMFFCSVTQAASLAKEAGQMMMVGFNGTTIDENSIIVREIKEYHIGGIILDYTNIQNPTQLKTLIHTLQLYAKKYHDYPLFITLNQEGGKIDALKFSQGFDTQNDPSQAQLGKNPDAIYQVNLKRAKLLKSLGINLNLAPVADLNINPINPAIGQLDRSFGSDPIQVTKDLKNAVHAYKKSRVLCTLKHFPGLGSADKNTDYDLANVSASWAEKELIPYQKLIAQNKVCPIIMVSHLVNTQLDSSGLPASLSNKIINKLLIQKLHFKGLVITDDMDAAAIRQAMPADIAIKKAVLAGNNIILYGGTQDFNAYQDADMLYRNLINLGAHNPEIRSKITASYKKIQKEKQHILFKFPL